MPLVTKKILTPGKYYVSVPAGNGKWKRALQDITKERIKSWVDKFTAMVQAGFKVPAPWTHVTNLQPMTDEQITELKKKEEAEGSRLNAGFWGNLFQDQDGALFGTVDVPLEDDHKRVGTTVQETSVFAPTIFTDGTGKVWEDALTHIALVTNPIEAGQENFKRLEEVAELNDEAVKTLALPTSSEGITEQSFAVAMSDLSMSVTAPNEVAPESKEACTGFNAKCLEILKSFGLTLPSSTTGANLCEMIINIGEAVLANRPNDGDETKNGLGPGKLRQVEKGFAMSHTIDVNTPEGKRMVKKYLKEVLEPMMAGTAMSVSLNEEGDFVQDGVDAVLTALEALPASSAMTGTGKENKKGQIVVGGTVMSAVQNDGVVIEMTPERVEEISNLALKQAGFRVPVAAK
jgi:hypothetical protein